MTISPASVFSTFTPAQIGGAVNVDQPVRIYINAGQQPAVLVQNFGTAARAGPISLSGYLFDCSIAPFAAIAQ